MNKYIFKDSYVIGITEDNKRFYFDLRDYEEFKKYDWVIDSKGYVIARIITHDYKIKNTMMQYFIMDKPTIKDGKTIDHINQMKTDNRRKNLRIITRSENQHNCKIRARNTTGVNGVHFSKGKYIATIKINLKNIYLGSFNNKEDAIKARRDAENKYLQNIKIAN